MPAPRSVRSPEGRFAERVELGAVILLAVGLTTLLDVFLAAARTRYYVPPALVSPRVLLAVTRGSSLLAQVIAFVAALAVAALFVWLWTKAYQGRRWPLLIGCIVCAFDLPFTILTRRLGPIVV